MLRGIFRFAFQPFSGNGASAAVAFGCVAGVVLAVSFRWLADPRAARVLRRKLWAHVLELRLFGEEPGMALGSLLSIARINALLVSKALPPLLAAAPFLALLAVQLNAFYTRTSLQTGGAAVLTVRLRGALEGSAPIDLRTPSWILVDAPPVHVPAAGEVSWRLRATAPHPGVCTISVGGETVTKELDSRPGYRYSGRVRSRAWLEALVHPAEDRLPDGPIERIWITEEPAPLTWAGVTMEWEEWFATAASLAACLLSVWLARIGRPASLTTLAKHGSY